MSVVATTKRGDPSALARFLNAIPLKLAVAFVALSLYLGEWYPVSHYPMYAAVGRTHWYVFVTDANDEFVPVETVFGTRTSFIKKIYKRRYKKVSKEQAGREALEFLVRESTRNRSLAPKVLKLWSVHLRIKGTEIERKRHLIAEYEVDDVE